MCNIESDEFFHIIKCLPDDKAAGLSGIPNKLWKYGNTWVLGGLLDILNTCLVLDAMSAHWRCVWILSKILFDKISVACSRFDVLQGDNFLVLKDISMQTPIFAIGLIVEDTLEKNREL
ncbi:hypothetical protein G9A89_017923 [Geosiphon pyriformis]|nr:hypothetical protein G9A89_017923 [Geosiphon pyriformis]